MDSTLTAKLPVVFDDGVLVVDIGMGNGDFVKYCFERRAAVVYGFEERDDLFIEAENKLTDYREYCKLYKQRLCRSDKFNDVEATRFDFIISHLPPVDLLKITVGKQLYPILMTSKYLDNIGSIIGSISGTPNLSDAPKTAPNYAVGQLRHPKMSDLKKYLEIKGYNVQINGNQFTAYRNGGIPFYSNSD
jgi:hypothetical protein